MARTDGYLGRDRSVLNLYCLRIWALAREGGFSGPDMCDSERHPAPSAALPLDGAASLPYDRAPVDAARPAAKE